MTAGTCYTDFCNSEYRSACGDECTNAEASGSGSANGNSGGSCMAFKQAELVDWVLTDLPNG
jgi:hypothetical protein